MNRSCQAAGIARSPTQLWKTVEIELLRAWDDSGLHAFCPVFMRLRRHMALGFEADFESGLREVAFWAITIKQA